MPASWKVDQCLSNRKDKTLEFNMDSKFTIETHRLKLVPLSITDDDVTVVDKILNDPGHNGNDFPAGTDFGQVYIRPASLDHFPKHGYGAWKYIEKASNQSIGMGGMLYKPFFEEGPIIHYSLLVEYRGQGLATEAVEGCIGYAEKIGVKKLHACIREDNIKSIELIERMGFVLEDEHYKYPRFLDGSHLVLRLYTKKFWFQV